MSSTYIGLKLRQLVVSRAHGQCEYCGIRESDTFFGCQIDHIISEKHGGLTESENLAYACATCNAYKGTDIGTVLPGSDVMTRFFNPRSDVWTDHFAVDATGVLISSLTPIGQATARILRFNSEERLTERKALRDVDQ